MPTLTLILILVAVLFVTLTAILRRYRRCPSDKILVIYGKTGRTASAKCVHGGVRKQVSLLLLIVLFITVSVAFRYQCQQDELKISKLEQELVDIKYKALSSSSNLTERCRESRLLEALRQGKDSVLQITNQPPYIINVGE